MREGQQRRALRWFRQELPAKAEKRITEWLAADVWVTLEIRPTRILSS